MALESMAHGLADKRGKTCHGAEFYLISERNFDYHRNIAPI